MKIRKHYLKKQLLMLPKTYSMKHIKLNHWTSDYIIFFREITIKRISRMLELNELYWLDCTFLSSCRSCCFAHFLFFENEGIWRSNWLLVEGPHQTFIGLVNSQYSSQLPTHNLSTFLWLKLHGSENDKQYH